MLDALRTLLADRGLHPRIPVQIGLCDENAAQLLVAAAAHAGFDTLEYESVASPGFNPTGFRITLEARTQKLGDVDALGRTMAGLARSQFIDLANLRGVVEDKPEPAAPPPPPFPRPLRLLEADPRPPELAAATDERAQEQLAAASAAEAGVVTSALAFYRREFLDPVMALGPDSVAQDREAAITAVAAAASVCVVASEPAYPWPADWPTRREAYAHAAALLPLAQISYEESCSLKGWDGDTAILIHERPGTGMGFRTVYAGGVHPGVLQARTQPDEGEPGEWTAFAGSLPPLELNVAEGTAVADEAHVEPQPGDPALDEVVADAASDAADAETEQRDDEGLAQPE